MEYSWDGGIKWKMFPSSTDTYKDIIMLSIFQLMILTNLEKTIKFTKLEVRKIEGPKPRPYTFSFNKTL